MQAASPEPVRVAARVAIAADLGELRALCRHAAPAALDRGRVEQQQVIAAAGAHAGENARQPLDRVRETGTALVEGVLARQNREEVSELSAGGAQEPGVGGRAHDRLGDGQADDLGVVEPAARVASPLGQEIVGGAVNCGQEHVEVGVHRRPPGRRRFSSADFGLSASLPLRSLSWHQSSGGPDRQPLTMQREGVTTPAAQ